MTNVIINFAKPFPKFYRRYYDLIYKFKIGLKSLLRQGLSEPEFYGDLVYKLKKIVGCNNFSAQFIKIISNYKKIGYSSIRVLHAGGSDFRLYYGSDLKTYLLMRL